MARVSLSWARNGEKWRHMGHEDPVQMLAKQKAEEHEEEDELDED